MEQPDEDDWLRSVFDASVRMGWCAKPYCTTCGCVNFRRAVWSGAARHAGLAIPFGNGVHPHHAIARLKRTDRESIARALIAGLRALPGKWLESDSLRTTLIEIGILRDLQFVSRGLEAELAGTTAGEALTRMRRHAADALERRRRYEASQTPEAIGERRRIKREASAAAHAVRLLKTLRRNAERVELLSALARQSPNERLKQLAIDRRLALDAVPAELIPSDPGELGELDRATAAALLTQIGRRRGRWGSLRRMLEHWIDSRP